MSIKKWLIDWLRLETSGKWYDLLNSIVRKITTRNHNNNTKSHFYEIFKFKQLYVRYNIRWKLLISKLLLYSTSMWNHSPGRATFLRDPMASLAAHTCSARRELPAAHWLQHGAQHTCVGLVTCWRCGLPFVRHKLSRLKLVVRALLGIFTPDRRLKFADRLFVIIVVWISCSHALELCSDLQRTPATQWHQITVVCPASIVGVTRVRGGEVDLPPFEGRPPSRWGWRRKHGRPHIGANGVSWPCLCYILRAIRAGRCRERRYADHIFIHIYSRMHHFVVKFSKFSSPQAVRGHWLPYPKSCRRSWV